MTGVAAGYVPADILKRVLDLAGLSAASEVVLAMEPPPARDPFRSALRDLVSSNRSG